MSFTNLTICFLATGFFINGKTDGMESCGQHEDFEKPFLRQPSKKSLLPQEAHIFQALKAALPSSFSFDNFDIKRYASQFEPFMTSAGVSFYHMGFYQVNSIDDKWVFANGFFPPLDSFFHPKPTPTGFSFFIPPLSS
ncbi:MAG: hypothetical protein JSS34_03105 [Proteobacteria bacterium]|nr:hypothetical protein [Pseudomonadota bacterium]